MYSGLLFLGHPVYTRKPLLLSHLRMSVITIMLVDFRHTWLLYINGISQHQKPTVKISERFQISAGIPPWTMPGVICEWKYVVHFYIKIP